MKATPRLVDADARALAARAFDRNVAVLAGAGTGKTSLLIERLLNAVADDPDDDDSGRGRYLVGEIAAITFTEKAAGEMRQRFADGLERLRGLAEGRAEPGNDEASRALAWLVEERGIARERISARAVAALEALDAAQVTTIHGFCAELLRRHPIEAGVDPGFEVDAGEHFNALFDEFWAEHVAARLADPAVEVEWRAALDRFALGEIRELTRSLARFVVPGQLLAVDGPQLDLDRAIRPRAEALIDPVRAARGELGAGTTKLCKLLAFGDTLLPRLAAEGMTALHEMLDAEMLDLLSKGKPSTSSKKIENREAINAVAAELFRMLRELSRVDEEAISRAWAPAREAALHFRERYLARGFVDFDGMLSLARDLLRDVPEVRAALKRRYRTLLVDEFQDTDPLQYEIVLMLAEREDRHAEDPWAAEPAPGRLFVVGDAKQSIYRFRGADYEAYRRAVDHIAANGGRALTLTTNFRSNGRVLDPVNRAFAPQAGIWRESAQQPEYDPIEPFDREPDPDAGIELWTLAHEGATLDVHRRRRAEAELIGEQLLALEAEQGLRWSEITILFRAFTGIAYYLRALRERQIPFVVDGGREFLVRPEVLQLISTVRAIERPGDAPALLGYLRSPAGAVPDAEIVAWGRRERSRWDWRAEIPHDELPALAAAFVRLRAIAAEVRELPADAAIRRVVRLTRLDILGALAFEGAQRVANLEKLASAAGELAADGRLSLLEVAEALAEGRLADIEADRPLADAGAEAVHITSIHRMKGLENRLVIVGDLAREDRSMPERSVAAERVRPTGCDEALSLQLGRAINGACALRRLDEREHREAEELRVQYVALTRARRRLVLVDGSPAEGDKKPPLALRIPRSWGYAPDRDGELLEGSVRVRRLTGGRARLDALDRTLDDRSTAVAGWERLQPTLAAAARARFSAPSGVHVDVPRPAVRADAGSATRRAIGIAVHRALEHWTDGEASSLVARGELDAAAAAVETGATADAVLDELIPMLRAFADSPLAARLIAATDGRREVPLLARLGETRLRGTIDLLLRETDGSWCVVDYKTDRDGAPATLLERYGAQLDAYRLGVARALDLATPPRGELWSVRDGTAAVRDGAIDEAALIERF